jgi:hypothetical protein
VKKRLLPFESIGLKSLLNSFFCHSMGKLKLKNSCGLNCNDYSVFKEHSIYKREEQVNGVLCENQFFAQEM